MSQILETIENTQQHYSIGTLYHTGTQSTAFDETDVVNFIKACAIAYGKGICVNGYFGQVIDAADGKFAEENYAEIAFEIPVYKCSDYYVNCIILSSFEYYTERHAFAHNVEYYITALQNAPNP